MLRCPVCASPLCLTKNKTYACKNNHSFDISKSGYTNLLLSKTNSGDNKEMVNARSNFLNLGYYKKLALKIKDIVKDYKNDVIVDAGCGTGYYSSFLKTENNTIYGFDISKFAIEKASKLNKNINYFVASSASFPLDNNVADIILTVFAPTFPKEFKRVLKDNGIFILVVPNKLHLYELKEMLYTAPYLNSEKNYSLDDFILIKKEDLTYKINIDKPNLFSLIQMTPYFYKTNPDSFKNIKDNTDLTLDFTIYVYKKDL